MLTMLLAGHMDLMLSEPASRMKGLEFMIKSEKGQHLDMDLLQLHKVGRNATPHTLQMHVTDVLCHRG